MIKKKIATECVLKPARVSDRSLSGLLLILLGGLSLQSATAESRFEAPDSFETVVRRQQGRMDATGLRWRTMRIYPQIEALWQSNDNLYETRENQISDVILAVRPSIAVRRFDERSVQTLSVYGVAKRLREEKTEDVEEYGARINSSFNFSDYFKTRFGAALDSRHEERNSPDSAAGLIPVPVKTLRVQGGAEWELGRAGLSAAAQYRKVDYDDVPASGGIINHDDRDRSEFSGEIKIGIGRNRGLQAVLYAGLDTRRYDTEVDDAGFRRDSDGYRIAVGGQFNHLNKFFLEGLIGLIDRSYDDPRLNEIDEPWTRIRVVWNISGLTTLQASLEEEIYETTLLGAAGVTSSRYGLRIDHELRRNLLIQLYGFWHDDQYLQLNRDDRTRGAGLSIEYQMNRHLIVYCGWTTTDRNSSATDILGASYDVNLFSVGITGRF